MKQLVEHRCENAVIRSSLILSSAACFIYNGTSLNFTPTCVDYEKGNQA